MVVLVKYLPSTYHKYTVSDIPWRLSCTHERKFKRHHSLNTRGLLIAVVEVSGEMVETVNKLFRVCAPMEAGKHDRRPDTQCA